MYCHRPECDKSDEDAYLCRFECKKYHRSHGLLQLYDAIYNLNVTRLRQLLSSFTPDMIKHLFQQYIIEIVDTTLLRYAENMKNIRGKLVNELVSTCGFSYGVNTLPESFTVSDTVDSHGIVTRTITSYFKEKIVLRNSTSTGSYQQWYDHEIQRQSNNWNSHENPVKYFLSSLHGFAVKTPEDLKQLSHYSEFSNEYALPEVVLKMLAENYPEYITTNLIENYIKKYGRTWIADILLEHYSCVEADEDVCFICCLPYQTDLIKCTCKCKSKIHLHCLIKLVRTCGEICKTCKTGLGSHIINDQIMFPEHGIYPCIRRHRYLKDDIKLQLHFSIAYLCVSRVKQLLRTMTSAQLLEYKHSADMYGLHETITKLRDTLYTNLCRKDYPEKFRAIESMLSLMMKIRDNL